MKKILCFIDGLGPGGAERQLVGLADLLQRVGYDVDVYCYHKRYFFEPFLEKRGVNIIKTKCNEKLGLSKIFESLKVIKKGKYDVVISFCEGPSAIASLGKIFMRKYKLIASERNTTQKITSKVKIRFNLLRLANYIVPNSNSQHAFIDRNFNFLSKKTHTITNFLDINRFCPGNQGVGRDGLLNMLIVGRHFAQKNGITFVKAIKLLKDKDLKIKVRWYGRQDQQYFKDTIKEVKKLGVEDMIAFYPQCENIEEKYREADVFCLPSLYEGFPNVICEAMSSGLPVVCSNVCDNPDLVEDGINGILFNPLSPEEIAKGIEKYYNLPKGIKLSIAKANREKAIKLFSESAFLDKYVNLIES